jgi:hypothetical protein
MKVCGMPAQMLEGGGQQQRHDRDRHRGIDRPVGADPAHQCQVGAEGQCRAEQRQIEQRGDVRPREIEFQAFAARQRDRHHEQRAIEHGPGIDLHDGQGTALIAGRDHVAQRGDHRGCQCQQQAAQLRAAQCPAGARERQQFAAEDQCHAGDTQGCGQHGGGANRQSEERPHAERVHEHHQREHHRDQARGQILFRQVNPDVVESEQQHALQRDPAMLARREAQRPAPV